MNCPVVLTTAAGEGESRHDVGVGSAREQVVKVVAWVAGLTLILPALFFTLESFGSFVEARRQPIIHSGEGKGKTRLRQIVSG